MADALAMDSRAAAVSNKPDQELDRNALKARWVLEIDRYDRKAGQFVKRGKKIVERYTADRKDEDKTVRYNVLWSNMQTLMPALYGKDPTPEVERRFKDQDPVGRVASDVVERCLSFLIGSQSFGDCIRQAVLDRLLPGRGVAWVRYVPHMRDMKVPPKPAADAASLTDDTETPQEVYWEEVKFDYVHWQDFGHTIARTWQEVDGVWRIVYLGKQELEQRFGKELAAQVPLDCEPEGIAKETEGFGELRKAKVYEIWDKRTKRAIWLHRDVAGVLDVRADPLGLQGFFPCPEPLQATVATSSFIPTADYTMWQDQAVELDRLTQRIASLTRAIKVVGVYDASVPALANILRSGQENSLVPVNSWAAFAEKGGLKGAVELLDVKQVAEILLQLYEARDRVKNDLWEISGVNDLLRGASDPDTTATAERIKANFSSVRLKDMQRKVQLFARDLIRLAGEIVCEHFSPEVIREMSGVRLLTAAQKAAIQQIMAPRPQPMALPVPVQPQANRANAAMPVQPGAQPQAQGPMPPQPGMQQANPQMPAGPQPQAAAPHPASMPPVSPKQLELLKEPSWDEVEALLRDDAARSFRIDIETDSTITQDEAQEQASRVQFADVVGKLLEGAQKIMEEVPELAPALAETFMFVLRSYKVGRPTEAAFQEAMDKLVQKAAQPRPPKPDPDETKMKGAIQIAEMKLRGDQQLAGIKAAADQQSKAQEIASEERLAKFHADMDGRVAQMQQMAQQAQFEAQARLEDEYKERDAIRQQAADERQRQFEAWQTQVEEMTRVVVAEIQARASAAAPASPDGGSAQPAAPQGPDLGQLLGDINGSLQQLLAGHAQLAQTVQALQADAAAPISFERDPETGRAIGITKGTRTLRIGRGADNRVATVN